MRFTHPIHPIPFFPCRTGPTRVVSPAALGNRLSPTFDQVKERRLREEKERAQRETQGCTFKPITKGLDLKSPPVPLDTPTRAASPAHSRSAPRASPKLVAERMSPSTTALAQQKQRREMIKLQEELKGCTFAPKLYTNGTSPRQAFVQGQQPKRSAPSSSSSRASPKAAATNFGDRLSPTPDQHKHRQERLQQEKLRTELAGCTFKPVRVASPPPGRGQGQQPSSPSSATFTKLYKQAEVRVQRLAAMQQEKKAAERSACTFKPVISSYTLHGTEPGAGGDTFERLYQDATVHQQMLDAKRREQEEADNRACPYSPTLPAYALAHPPTDHAPVYERLYADQAHHHAMEEMQRQQQEAERRACTFSPTIPSYVLEKPSPSGPDIFHRLYHDRQHQQALQEAQQRQQETDRRNCTFSPILPHYPLSSLHSPAAGGGVAPIHERLYQEATVQRQVRDELVHKKEEAEVRACSFSPTLPAYPLHQQPEQAHLPVHERLYEEADIHKQIQEEVERRRQEVELQDCTFQPQIPAYPLPADYQYHRYRPHEEEEEEEKERGQEEEGKAGSLEHAEEKEEELEAIQEGEEGAVEEPIEGQGDGGIYPIPEDEEEEGEEDAAAAVPTRDDGGEDRGK